MKLKEFLAELTFYGRQCTKDCSGHTAGHAWGQQQKAISPADCSGSSASFIGGCEVAAHQAALAKVRATQGTSPKLRTAQGRFQSKGQAAMQRMAQQLVKPPPTIKPQ